ncbi:MAG: hypothetical protein U5J95_02270 [Balneolaceae bacterium]|nr:hypothetical protein [Balneolaceae bacterium]
MADPKRKKQELKIDEGSHRLIPTKTERLVNALISGLLAFALFHIIGFWMFPGLGWYGLKPFKGFFGLGAYIEVIDIAGFSFVALSIIMGWFRGKYFVDRLAGYFDFWKFW